MKMKRATIGGIIVYSVIFVFASIILYGRFVELGMSMIFIIPIVVFLVSKFYYFKEEKPEELLKESFFVGFYWMVLAIVLDTIILVYGLGKGLDYFMKANWTMSIGYLEIILFCIVGAFGKKILNMEVNKT